MFKRRQLYSLFLMGFIVSLIPLGCASASFNDDGVDGGSVSTVTLTVSAAASLQDALEAITPVFSENHPDITVDYNFASSGALQQQIQQGAPADLFFSAATRQMDTLEAKGLILSDSRQALVTNTLVLIAPQTSPIDRLEIAELEEIEIDRLAVGEFRSVPAGQYAEQVFKSLDLLVRLQSKFVFSNNVRSVLAAVESANADFGMVYATDAALSNRVKILATAPAESHAPIVYPIAIINSSPHPDEAQIFIQFLTTDTAQQILAQFGFSPVPALEN